MLDGSVVQRSRPCWFWCASCWSSTAFPRRCLLVHRQLVALSGMQIAQLTLSESGTECNDYIRIIFVGLLCGTNLFSHMTKELASSSFGDEVQARCGLVVIPSTLRQRQGNAQHHDSMVEQITLAPTQIVRVAQISSAQCNLLFGWVAPSAMEGEANRTKSSEKENNKIGAQRRRTFQHCTTRSSSNDPGLKIGLVPHFSVEAEKAIREKLNTSCFCGQRVVDCRILVSSALESGTTRDLACGQHVVCVRLC